MFNMIALVLSCVGILIAVLFASAIGILSIIAIVSVIGIVLIIGTVIDDVLHFFRGI